MKDWVKKLSDLNIEYEGCADLSSHSTMKLKATAPLVVLKSLDEVKLFQKIANDENINFALLGLGANQLLESRDGIYVRLKLNDEIKLEDGKCIVPASTPLSSLTKLALERSFAKWDVFTGIPATVGGAIFMNAGTSLGEMCEIIYSVKYIDKCGNELDHIVKDEDFSYRSNSFLDKKDIIVGATLKCSEIDKDIPSKIRSYLKYRNETQPMSAKNCGCIFKNYKKDEITCAAGKFIDILGLKGLSELDVRVSPMHGNFFENTGSATKNDVESLIEIVREELLLNFGLEFEREVK